MNTKTWITLLILATLWLAGCGKDEPATDSPSAVKETESSVVATPEESPPSGVEQPANGQAAEETSLSSGDSDSPSTADEGQATDVDATDVDTAAVDAAAADLAAAASLPGSPPLALMTAEPAAAQAGDPIKFTSEKGVAGRLRIFGLDGATGEMSDGAASWSIPAGTADGLYYAAVEGESGIVAWAPFRVASAPGVWLRANRLYAGGPTGTRLSVEGYGLPEGLNGAVYLLDEAGGDPIPYVPDESGRLFPGAPVDAQNLTSRALFLPGQVAGRLEVRLLPDPFAGPVEGAVEFISNPLELTMCTTTGAVAGNLGSAGYVTVIWAGDGLHTQSLFTAGGEFQVDVPAGLALIRTFTEAGEMGQEMVKVACGETVTLAASGSRLHVAGRQIAQAKERRLFSLAAASERWLPALQTGRDQPCRAALIDARVTAGSEDDAALAQAAAAALKSAATEAAPQASYVTYADVGAFLEEAAGLMLQGEDEGGQEAIEAAGEALQVDFLITLHAAKFGEGMAVGLAGLPLNDEDAGVRAHGSATDVSLRSSSLAVYQSFVADFRHAAICGEVDPADRQITAGETVQLTYTLTDLSGEPASGAEVTISDPACGQLDPAEGSIDGGQFQTSYQFPENDVCVEQLEFKARWNGPAGGVETMPREAVATLYPEPISMNLYVGSVPAFSPEAHLVGAVSSGYPDWVIEQAPEGLPAIQAAGECNYLEGGQEAGEQFWYVHSNHEGGKGEGSLSVLLGESSPADPTPQTVQLRFTSKSSAFPIIDDGVARSASGFSGNYSDVFSTGNMSSAVFLYDIQNPGELPNWHPAFVWQSQINNDNGYFQTFMFYKIINCGSDAGLGGMESFFSANVQPLLSFADDEPGETNGNLILPALAGDRTQILLYVMSVSSAGSILDSDDGIYQSGIASQQIDLQLYFVQELTGE